MANEYITIKITCPDCGGKGGFTENHKQFGIIWTPCYICGGKGYLTITEKKKK